MKEASASGRDDFGIDIAGGKTVVKIVPSPVLIHDFTQTFRIQNLSSFRDFPTKSSCRVSSLLRWHSEIIAERQ